VPRIAFVDDDADLRETIASYLELRGFDVSTHESTEETLRDHDNRPFDIVVTDLSLRGASGGAELARMLRARNHPPILVAMSGSAEAMQRHADTFDATVLKPVTLEPFIRQLHSLIARTAGSPG
jgi:DNA-binding response OmpR family regulator